MFRSKRKEEELEQTWYRSYHRPFAFHPLVEILEIVETIKPTIQIIDSPIDNTRSIPFVSHTTRFSMHQADRLVCQR